MLAQWGSRDWEVEQTTGNKTHPNSSQIYIATQNILLQFSENSEMQAT